ncbi:hypothetical protein KYC5002_43705 [Archangium violaceum]|uniref:hypothetical protein n=1 Tax=Archangium violaceum TaxID=83451 RepID=UPI002B281B6C|nr:hypothetical protein KYC5002_43705 [Archangium gephyra]
MSRIETFDTADDARWETAHVPVDKVETTAQKRWATEEKPRPMENLRFEAFQILVWLAILSVAVYAILLASEAREMIDFATIVVAPIMTIVASAAGYYFGSRTSRQVDGQEGEDDSSR